MSDGKPARIPPVTYLSLMVACFSLATAAYQGYLQTRNMEAVQRDITRSELLQGCRDAIEAYFEVKLRIGLLADIRAAGQVDDRMSAASVEASVALSRFSAIATFLANGQDGDVRERYTALSRALERHLQAVRNAAPVEERTALFADADALFRGMNDDCVKSAHQILH